MLDAAFILGVITLVVTAIIAIRQHGISRRTLTLVKAIESAKKTQKLVDQFFGPNSNWQVHLPVNYHQKPLPVMAAGDYHALHVISSRLGDDRTFLEFVNVSKGSDDSSSAVPHDNNSLFLCSPLVNKALGKIYPAVTEENLASGKLPCWFQVGHAQAPDWLCFRVLKDHTKHRPVISVGANEAYRICAELPKNTAPVDLPNQVDRAILARLGAGNRGGTNGKIDIIMAGIHQFGTWIVADFVDQLIRGKQKTGQDIFLNSSYEFVAIIEGEFAPNDLRVNWSNLCGQFLWYRRSGTSQWLFHGDYAERKRRRSD